MEWILGRVLFAAALLGSAQQGHAAGETPSAAAQELTQEQEAKDLGVEAYIYAYPLVTMELTRRVSTNVSVSAGGRAPMGQFARLRGYPTAESHTVTAPNADTLYTIVWLDVSKEPWIVSAPDMKRRYFLLPMLDGWTNVFANPGTRTTGTGAQKFAITGPGWRGKLPAGITEYKSATGMVWLLGRIYCTGTPQDYQAAHALQDQMSAVPLSAYGKRVQAPAPASVDPNFDMKTGVRAQVNAMDARSYFKLFAELLKNNPPAAEDGPIVARLATIGIVPGSDFDASRLDPATAKGLEAVPKPAQEEIMGWIQEGTLRGDAKFIHGWFYSTNTGVYGTNYRRRALTTAIGLGANLPRDTVYPVSRGSSPLEAYSGANKYVLHFNKGELPPVNGFWSLTMYDADFFFVPNPINRYTLSQRDKFAVNADGSVDLFIQNEAPGEDRQANWLPAPKDKFILMMRLYWPKEEPPSILDGSWSVPPVVKSN